ncbi:MAG: methyltransferase domain-containing protein [Candidatus Komeilibacteria bacterium]|nr:methyltransferase domain-containing protein [Candidatus Komeilibacteria bacterium]
MKKEGINILFSGRHHMLTKWQQQYLRNCVTQGCEGQPVKKIIFAVTSSNHQNTRRNPLPLYLRAMALESFARVLGVDYKIYPIPDVKMTDKFAKYLVRQIYYQSGEELTPANTVVACSTPSVIRLFATEGFAGLPVELQQAEPETYHTLRPYEVIDLLVSAGSNWRQDIKWREYASLATQQIYDAYNLGDLIVEVFSDLLLNDDADLTDTRDYNAYARGMDDALPIKFEDIRPFIKQGKIVDAGCGTGALVSLLAKHYPESDIIGVEGTRRFYEHCQLQDYPNPYVFFYRRNITDQIFKSGTITSYIYSSVLHEIYSYINEEALLQVLRNTFIQLEPGGRLIIRDVVGPEDPHQVVLMELNSDDGQDSGDLNELSTKARFYKFVADFQPRSIKHEIEIVNGKEYIKLKLQDAYEFMSKKDYTDNWSSEMHEEFGFYSFTKWQETLESLGYEVLQSSKAFQNPYIITNSYEKSVRLWKVRDGQPTAIDYPATNMILVAEKPLL